jgi:hypothetical protein
LHLVAALRVLETLKLGKWLLGTSDRRGQDKSRKVRRVGRLENAGDFKRAPNVAKIRHNKVSKAAMKCLDITGDQFHPEWNYTIRPRPS